MAAKGQVRWEAWELCLLEPLGMWYINWARKGSPCEGGSGLRPSEGLEKVGPGQTGGQRALGHLPAA